MRHLQHVMTLAIAVLGLLAFACGSTTGTASDGGADGTLSDGSHGHADGSTGKDAASTHDGAIFGGDGGCLKFGGACKVGADCCGGACKSGVCEFPACTSDGLACSSGSQCCSGTCGSGKCTAINTTCKTLGNACKGSTECCSGLCSGGVCAASSFCEQNGDICAVGADCCGGVCTLMSGSSMGTCGQPPHGASNCTAVDGTLCGGVGPDGGVTLNDAGLPACGGSCCSRLCAPYGPTGVLICQPATGCHVVGDLCTKDSDCCGSAGLPGGPKKPVTCDITAPDTVGVCRNPIGCKPNGDVCKLATSSCNASCDCCSGNCETMDTCKQDKDGVPRCTGAMCVDAGASCASSADCCNGLPCVPDPSFVDGGKGPPFVCGTTTCVKTCGLCTTDADCCPGSPCVLGTGSSVGVCGPCGGGGTDGGAGKDSGTPKDSGPMCALFGQACTTTADCCNGVPCSFNTGPCATGDTGCTCHNQAVP